MPNPPRKDPTKITIEVDGKVIAEVKSFKPVADPQGDVLEIDQANLNGDRFMPGAFSGKSMMLKHQDRELGIDLAVPGGEETVISRWSYDTDHSMRFLNALRLPKHFLEIKQSSLNVAAASMKQATQECLKAVKRMDKICQIDIQPKLYSYFWAYSDVGRAWIRRLCCWYQPERVWI